MVKTELSGHARIALGKLADGEWHPVSNRNGGRRVAASTAEALRTRGWVEVSRASYVRITEAGRQALAELEAGS